MLLCIFLVNKRLVGASYQVSYRLDLTTFYLHLSKITSNLPENYLDELTHGAIGILFDSFSYVISSLNSVRDTTILFSTKLTLISYWYNILHIQIMVRPTPINHFSTTSQLCGDHLVRHSQRLCKKINYVTSNHDFSSTT